MMTESEIFVSKQIRTLVPNYDSVELKATVSSSSFSVEFFITISGKKMQCFEMIDKGMFTERISILYQKPLQITSEDYRTLTQTASINIR